MPRPLPCMHRHRTSRHQIQHLLLTPAARRHSPALQNPQPHSIHHRKCCYSLQPQPPYPRSPQHHRARTRPAHNLRCCSMRSSLPQTPPFLDEYGTYLQPAASHYTALSHPWTSSPTLSVCPTPLGPRPLSPGVHQEQSFSLCTGQHSRAAHPSPSHPGVTRTQLQFQASSRRSPHWD